MIEKNKNSRERIFNPIVNREVTNFASGIKYQMIGGEDVEFSDSDISKIAQICSQDEVYNTLFKKMLEGKPYTEDNARGFIDWVKSGWKDQTHFVFFVRNKNGEIIGAIDIKSANTDRAEIGYWADKNYSGFMTNTVKELIHIAKESGFKKLFADVLSNNIKSSAVLDRAGFSKVGEYEKDGGQYLTYEKELV